MRHALISVCLLSAFLSGCRTTSYENSSTDAPNQNAVSPDIDSKAKLTAEEFIKAVQSKDPAKAFSLFTPQLQKQLPLPQLKEMIELGSLKPLGSQVKARFNSGQVNSKSNRMTLRIAFDNTSQENYRMNLVLEKFNDNWRINSFVPPTKHRDPSASSGKTSAAQ